jgi:mannosyl-3-phosphoglycerate phosphatase
VKPLLVATDLDSCLLDEHYRHAEAAEALAALRERGVPVVLASSKTRAEIEPLWRELALETPFIVENGGAVLFPDKPRDARARRRGGLYSLDLGTPRGVLVAALAEIGADTGARLTSFAALRPERVALVTGLSPSAARRACERRFDEPFLCDEERADAVTAAAARRGLRVTRGGRFFHLSGASDKGAAFAELLRLWRPGTAREARVALGDSPNDAGLLLAVERPIVVPRPGGVPDAVLAAAVPHAEQAPEPGPAGWNAAVLAVLEGRALPRLAA